MMFGAQITIFKHIGVHHWHL